MDSTSRRAFLGTSLATLAAVSVSEAGKKNKLENLGLIPDLALSTLFLTWQRDPTTTMTVQWVGAERPAAEAYVSYTKVGEKAWQRQKVVSKPFPLSTCFVHRAELTKLAPGTDYQFTVGSQSPVLRFQTMPAKATNTIQFISGGDCGVNEHTVANNIQAARQDPQFAIIGGDLAYDNGSHVQTFLQFLQNYSRHMVTKEGRLIPMLACLGNHEVHGGYAQPREKAPFFYAMFDGLFRDTGYASLDFGDYLSLVLLDSGHTSAIGGAQADWLDKTLQARADHPNVLAINHVPAYPSYRKMEGPEGKAGTGSENRKHWVPLFEKHRVPVVLEHHDHTFKRSRPLLDNLVNKNGVLYLGDGSWGRLRTPQAPEKLPYLAKTSRDYHLSLHRIEGEERFHLGLDESGKVMDVCRSGQRLLK